MVRVVGVHGIGNLLPERLPADAANHLAKVWSSALATSMGRVPVDLRMAYYADRLHGELPQGGGVENLPDGAQQMIASWAAALGAPPEIAQGLATVPVRQIVSWVCERFGLEHRLVGWFVREFFGEVATYMRDPEAPARSQARERVSQMLETHQPHVVVAHSLGSVVAFETLCIRDDLRVDTLITLGSPLGMPDVVFDRLQSRSDSPPKRPSGVGRWINIADIGDIVAVPRKLGGRFDVDIDHEVNIALFDFHRVKRYLASPVVGTAIGSVPH